MNETWMDEKVCIWIAHLIFLSRKSNFAATSFNSNQSIFVLCVIWATVLLLMRSNTQIVFMSNKYATFLLFLEQSWMHHWPILMNVYMCDVRVSLYCGILPGTASLIDTHRDQMRIVEFGANCAQHNALSILDQWQFAGIEYQTDIWIFKIELFVGTWWQPCHLAVHVAREIGYDQRFVSACN